MSAQGLLAPDAGFEGIHCTLAIGRRSDSVVLLRIAGTDIAEFGDAPMKALDQLLAGSGRVHLFIDARAVRGASMAVSGDWAHWLKAHEPSLASITMLRGSRFIRMTAEFVRRFVKLEGSMSICDDTAVFERLLANATGI